MSGACLSWEHPYWPVWVRVFLRVSDDASAAVVREEIRYVPEPGLLNVYRDWKPGSEATAS